MNMQTRTRFPCRLAGALLVAMLGLGGALPAGADTLIDTIVVRYSDGAVAPEGGAPPGYQLPALSQALGVGYRVAGRTRDGAFRLQLDAPLPVDEARAAINRIRLGTAVLYANAEVTGAGRAVSGRSTDRLIVRYRETAQNKGTRGGPPLQVAEVARLSALGGQPLSWVRKAHDGGHVLQMLRRLPADQAAAVAATLAQQPDVEYAEPDAIWTIQGVPVDPCYASAGETCAGGYQWDLFDPVGGINMPAAWDLTTGSAAIKVAIIDTGALNHPDLAGTFLPGYDMIGDVLVANDGNGRDGDASDAGDWVTAAENASGYFAGCGADNSSWHGTHVAGTIGANPNAMGIAGINWESGIVPVRVLGKCGGYTSDINDAIVWAAGGTVGSLPLNGNPARVINLSLGGGGACPASTQAAINTALGLGTVVAVAAGNSNSNAANFSPASCNGVITVAATTKTGKRASYSNYGTAVEIAAPGGDAVSGGYNILSTLNSGAQSPDSTGWIYANYAGTSMATPHVAGVVSLMLSRNPALTPSQVLAKLQYAARAFPSGSNCTTSTCGAGILDAGIAVAIANASPAGTTTALVSSANPSTYGQSVTFTATVSGAVPKGSVAFKDGATTIAGCGAVALSGGKALCVSATLAVGTHSVTAAYSGDVNNATSTSAALSQSVGKATTATGVASSANPTKAGRKVTYTATVTGISPAGTVDFTDGGSAVAGCTAVSLAGSGNSRKATCSATPSAKGTHTITGSYKGDSNNLPSSGSMTLTVK